MRSLSMPYLRTPCLCARKHARKQWPLHVLCTRGEVIRARVIARVTARHVDTRPQGHRTVDGTTVPYCTRRTHGSTLTLSLEHGLRNIPWSNSLSVVLHAVLRVGLSVSTERHQLLVRA